MTHPTDQSRWFLVPRVNRKVPVYGRFERFAAALLDPTACQ